MTTLGVMVLISQQHHWRVSYVRCCKVWADPAEVAWPVHTYNEHKCQQTSHLTNILDYGVSSTSQEKQKDGWSEGMGWKLLKSQSSKDAYKRRVCEVEESCGVPQGALVGPSMFLMSVSSCGKDTF